MSIVKVCPKCRGRRMVECEVHNTLAFLDCPKCNGKGWVPKNNRSSGTPIRDRLFKEGEINPSTVFPHQAGH